MKKLSRGQRKRNKRKVCFFLKNCHKLQKILSLFVLKKCHKLQMMPMSPTTPTPSSSEDDSDDDSNSEFFVCFFNL